MSVDCAGLMCLSLFLKCWSLSLDICLYASLRDFAMSLTNPVRPAPGTAPQPDVDDSSLDDGLPHSLMTTACPQAEPDDDPSLDDVPKLEEVELLQMEADAEQTLAAKIMAECFLRGCDETPGDTAQNDAEEDTFDLENFLQRQRHVKLRLSQLARKRVVKRARRWILNPDLDPASGWFRPDFVGFHSGASCESCSHGLAPKYICCHCGRDLCEFCNLGCSGCILCIRGDY